MKEPREKPSAEKDSRSRQEVVASMSIHFQETGAFYGRDIINVIGHPLDSVEVRSSERVLFSAKPGW